MFTPTNKIENELEFPMGFTSGDLFGFVASDCLFPSK